MPKLICKSCAVKLIRIRENITLFKESDRRLRDKLRNNDELPDVFNELRQDRKRKYIRREKIYYDDSEEDKCEDTENLIPVKLEKNDTVLESLECTDDHM